MRPYSDLIGDIVLAKDVALYDLGFCGLRYVGGACWKNCITIVCPTVLCEEADKSL